MDWWIFACVGLAWLLVFIFTAWYPWRKQEYGTIVRSVLNILVIQLAFFDGRCRECGGTEEAKPTWMTFAIVSSAVWYNLGDCVLITIMPGWAERYRIFYFHHACVIIGALVPVCSDHFFDLYEVGAMYEWTSGAYNIAQLASLSFFGSGYTKAQKRAWHLLYLTFFASFRLLGAVCFLIIFWRGYEEAPLFWTIAYGGVTIGISVFSVFAVHDIYTGGETFNGPDAQSRGREYFRVAVR